MVLNIWDTIQPGSPRENHVIKVEKEITTLKTTIKIYFSIQVLSCWELSRKRYFRNNSNKAEWNVISIIINETINFIIKEAYYGSAVVVFDILYYYM